MPRLTIPIEQRSGFQRLAALDADTAAKLITALGSEQPSLSMRGLIGHVADQVSGVEVSVVRDMLNAVTHLILVGTDNSMSLSELVDAVVTSEVLELSDERRESLRQTLDGLFDCQSLVVTAKATGVLFEHPNIYASARVITDIRPVFLNRPEVGPTAALIVHSLRITYLKEGRSEEFFVALDTIDVDDLRKVLDRAVQKTPSLRSLVENSGLDYLEVMRD